jgi:hypothetical protein
MIKVAVLDDYQNVFEQIIDTNIYKDNFEFTIFNEHFLTESEAIISLEDFEALFIMRERTALTKNLIDGLPKLKYIMTSGMRNNSINLKAAKEKKIIVTGTEINPNPAAELTWALILGLFRNFKQNIFEFSTEVYYKVVDNTIDYRNGAEITLNPTVEGELLYGEGRAYGLELYFKKRKGKFTGWLSYTLSKSENRFDELNDGEWYSAKQDRTHDISLVGMYALTDRIKLSSTFVFYTGNAVTFPTGKYQIDNQTINLYSDRNGSRMPNYHRMDVGLTLDGKKYKEVKNLESGEIEKVKKKFTSSWNFSVYNLYARENAYSISFQEKEDNPSQTEIIQTSLFKIIPSITYNFKF